MCFDKTGTITQDGLSFSGIRPVVDDASTPLALADTGTESLPRVGECVLNDIESACGNAALGEANVVLCCWWLLGRSAFELLSCLLADVGVFFSLCFRDGGVSLFDDARWPPSGCCFARRHHVAGTPLALH